MNKDERSEIYAQTMQMLKPALDRVASDPAFRSRLEANPLDALAEMQVELDAETRSAMEGRRFSEFWALRRKVIEGPIEVRDLPPRAEELDAVTGGRVLDPALQLQTPILSPVASQPPRGISDFAPPYVPVGPVNR